jgi:glycosyltransferase involved in cell wall biosynthesis
MPNRTKIDLSYFLSHPVQYFSPLFRELAKSTRLKVYYFSHNERAGKKDAGFGQTIQWDTPLTAGYESASLKNWSPRVALDNHFWDVFNPGLLWALWKDKSSIVIVNGWTYSSSLLIIFFGRLFGKAVWLRSENPLNQELEKNPLSIFLKKILLQGILFRIFISRFLYIGTESRRFFEYYGVKPSKLVYTPYAVDNDFFEGQYLALEKDKADIRMELGIPAGKKIILFCGKYISKKRPLDLLQAFKLLNNKGYALVMVGEGELRGEMEEYIRTNDLLHVYLTGFINQSRISRYYILADVFVMCSGAGETWGLSVNEAMNFEKPVIVSKTCGCCADLVKHGENGFAFGTGNISELAGYLAKILENDDFRISAGRRSGQLIKDYSIGNIVVNIVAALA